MPDFAGKPRKHHNGKKSISWIEIVSAKRRGDSNEYEDKGITGEGGNCASRFWVCVHGEQTNGDGQNNFKRCNIFIAIVLDNGHFMMFIMLIL